MKDCITYLGCIMLFLVGTQDLLSQEVMSQKLTNENSYKLTPEQIAKQQTDNLSKLLNLDEDRMMKVQGIFLSIEKEMAQIPSDLEESKRMVQVNKIENLKNEQLKEVLGVDQFTVYLNSMRNQ